MNAYRQTRLFLVSSLALTMAGVGAALRANTASDLQRIFLDPIDKAHSGEMIANVLGLPFLGFALTIAIGSPLLDYIGMGLLLPLSGICFTAGALIMMFAGSLAEGSAVYTVIWAGALVTGIGWGLVETVVNPLIASLYPEDKTAKLNTLHAWWPGGLVIGGLLGVAMSGVGTRMAGEVVRRHPAGAGGRRPFDWREVSTHRARGGRHVDGRDVSRAAQPAVPDPLLRDVPDGRHRARAGAMGGFRAQPDGAHAGHPAARLRQRVDVRHAALRGTAGAPASPIGLLWVSCLMGSLGLVASSVANSPITGLLAATVWGTGVCYMWPTMLATASERFPRGGALLMGLMGTAGTLSIRFVLPIMGSIYDAKKIEVAGGEAAFAALPPGPELERVLGIAAQSSFRAVAVLPAVLLIVFGGIWLYDRRRGGYHAKRLSCRPARCSGVRPPMRVELVDLPDVAKCPAHFLDDFHVFEGRLQRVGGGSDGIHRRVTGSLGRGACVFTGDPGRLAGLP